MPERAQQQAEAERAVRRGELREALAILHRLLAQSPDDAQLRARIAAIESLLQPSELSGAAATSAAAAAAAPIDPSRPPTLEQTAEMLFERGDIAGAIATYERVLRDKPDELARERLGELRTLHAVSPKAPPVPDLPEGKPELFEALLARIAARRK